MYLTKSRIIFRLSHPENSLCYAVAVCSRLSVGLIENRAFLIGQRKCSRALLLSHALHLFHTWFWKYIMLCLYWILFLCICLHFLLVGAGGNKFNMPYLCCVVHFLDSTVISMILSCFCLCLLWQTLQHITGNTAGTQTMYFISS